MFSLNELWKILEKEIEILLDLMWVMKILTSFVEKHGKLKSTNIFVSIDVKKWK